MPLTGHSTDSKHHADQDIPWQELLQYHLELTGGLSDALETHTKAAVVGPWEAVEGKAGRMFKMLGTSHVGLQNHHLSIVSSHGRGPLSRAGGTKAR